MYVKHVHLLIDSQKEKCRLMLRMESSYMKIHTIENDVDFIYLTWSFRNMNQIVC